jgi:hypothetical protein
MKMGVTTDGWFVKDEPKRIRQQRRRQWRTVSSLLRPTDARAPSLPTGREMLPAGQLYALNAGPAPEDAEPYAPSREAAHVTPAEPPHDNRAQRFTRPRVRG